MFRLVTEEEVDEETVEEIVKINSEKMISDEMTEIFVKLWDKEPNPTVFPDARNFLSPVNLSNIFWKTFEGCQNFPDRHALNSKKMVGWKLAARVFQTG